MRDFIEHRDYYIEKGEVIFTEYYLLKRKECCKNNCRHCPYSSKQDTDDDS